MCSQAEEHVLFLLKSQFLSLIFYYCRAPIFLWDSIGFTSLLILRYYGIITLYNIFSSILMGFVSSRLLFSLMESSLMLMSIFSEELFYILRLIKLSDDDSGFILFSMLHHFSGCVWAKEEHKHRLDERKDSCKGQDDSISYSDIC